MFWGYISLKYQTLVEGNTWHDFVKRDTWKLEYKILEHAYVRT